MAARGFRLTGTLAAAACTLGALAAAAFGTAAAFGAAAAFLAGAALGLRAALGAGESESEALSSSSDLSCHAARHPCSQPLLTVDSCWVLFNELNALCQEHPAAQMNVKQLRRCKMHDQHVTATCRVVRFGSLETIGQVSNSV